MCKALSKSTLSKKSVRSHLNQWCCPVQGRGGDMGECFERRHCSGEQVKRGEDFSWSFLSPLTGGRERKAAARRSNRAFFLLTFVSRETREEKGHTSVQLQSLAGAQAKTALVFHAGNVLLTKICLCSNPW